MNEPESSKACAVIERPLGEVTETWQVIRRVFDFRLVAVLEDTGVKGFSEVGDAVDEAIESM